MKGKLLAFLGAALVATPAIAGLIDDGWPPERYQGNVEVTIMFVPGSSIETFCGSLENATVLGCTLADGRIVLPNPNGDIRYQREDFARLVGHEIGHVNGWPGDHPRP